MGHVNPKMKTPSLQNQEEEILHLSKQGEMPLSARLAFQHQGQSTAVL